MDERNSVGVPASPSGHSAEPEPISVVSAVPVSIPNARPPEMWAIGGNWPYFEVAPTPGAEWNYMHTANDAAVNGVYTSRIEALAHLITSLEETRKQLSGEIAKHKRALRSAIAMEARRGETPKSGSTAEGGDSAGRQASHKDHRHG